MGREQANDEVPISASPDEAFLALQTAFPTIGKVRGSEPQFRRITGKIKAGAANMNPATVTARIDERDGGCTLVVQAVAREGLVGQGTAPGAISRLLDAFSAQLRL